MALDRRYISPRCSLFTFLHFQKGLPRGISWTFCCNYRSLLRLSKICQASRARVEKRGRDYEEAAGSRFVLPSGNSINKGGFQWSYAGAFLLSESFSFILRMSSS